MVAKLHKLPPSVQRLYDRGIKSVIPLFKGKNPGYSDWQKISEEEAQEKFWSWDRGEEEKLNYGIRLGPAFGDICDIDLDSSESRELAKYYLPDTARFGRGGVCTHYLFRQIGTGKEGSRRFQWDKRDEKTVLLEIRASGQTMGPGSVHPVSGEMIEWMSDGVILDISGPDLMNMVRQLAAASLLLRDWESGSRDELAVCLIGSMLRADWSAEDIDSFLEPILVESGDEEGVKRLKAERLERELRSGGRVPGLKRLRELCSDGGIGFERIVEWLELGGGDLIEEINNEFAVVTLRGGGAAIMREDHDAGVVSFMDQTSFKLLWANTLVGHRGREVTADRFWLGHRDRREYLRGVVFNPGKDVRDGEYNLWRGFAVAEVESEGEGGFGAGWEVFLDHLREEICGGSEGELQWLLGWMAHRVQRPWEVPESAVVLIGERGDGKSSVFKIFGKLFGKHYLSVTNPKQLLGNFNAHMMDKVLVLADEAVWGGDKTNEGILKTMISEDDRIIEIKGKDAFSVRNCTGYGVCSNNDWVVPVGRHERRFYIVRTRGRHRGDLDYWDHMYDVMSVEGGGLGRMLWDLKRLDIGGWRGNRPPKTEELAAQASRGVEHWVQFIVWLHAGGGLEEGCGWWADDLYGEYLTWSARMRFRVESEVVFFRSVLRMLPATVKTRGNRLVSKVTLRSGVHTEREKKNRYIFHRVNEGIKLFLGNGDIL